jgi:hypothetical protein
MYLNGAPIDWFSKKQNTIESSSFGSEFVALKTVMEKLRGLRYKLHMMGFQIDGPTYASGVASGELVVAHVPGVSTPSKLLTKAVRGRQRREALVQGIMHDISEYVVKP